MGLETVLLAVGEGDRDRVDALAEIAADVAGPAGATVVLAHVFTEREYERAREDLDFGEYSEVTPDAVAERYTTIRTLSEAMEAADVAYSIRGRIADGDAIGEPIVSLAGAVGADLVVVGGRKRSPAGKAVFGSTAQEVMLNAPCPVTFVRG